MLLGTRAAPGRGTLQLSLSPRARAEDDPLTTSFPGGAEGRLFCIS